MLLGWNHSFDAGVACGCADAPGRLGSQPNCVCTTAASCIEIVDLHGSLGELEYQSDSLKLPLLLSAPRDLLYIEYMYYGRESLLPKYSGFCCTSIWHKALHKMFHLRHVFVTLGERYLD